MPDENGQAELLIWAEARRVPMVQRLIDQLGDRVKIAALGGPRRGEVADLAESLGLAWGDDLRQLLHTRPAGAILFAGVSGVRRDDLAGALAQGISIFACEPLAGATEEVLHPTDTETAHGNLFQLPLLRMSQAFRAAAEPQEALGEIQAVQVTHVGQAQDLSLYARLADAMDFAVHLIGVPDQIDAALTGGLVEPPEQLRGLAGHMTINLRRADQASAMLCISDRSPVHHRGAVVLGRTGILSMDDQSYVLHTFDDQPLDESKAKSTLLDPAALIAEQLCYHLKHRVQRDTVDRRTIIGCCETALLATRTGQGESTDRILRVV